MDKLFRHIERCAFNAALQQLGTQNIQQLVHLEIRLAQHLNGFIGFIQLNFRFYTAKIETRFNLTGRVIHTVARFLKINFRDNIERWHLFPSLSFFCVA